MLAHKALTTLLLTFLLTIGTVVPSFFIPSVHAETTQGYTTLYFTDALNFLETENISELGFALLTQQSPRKLTDSEYPPAIFYKNTTKILPRYNLNINDTLNWFLSAWIFQYLENSSEFNFSDLYDLFGNDASIELFIPNPYRVVEEYVYDGNDTVTINGNISFNLYFSPPNNNRQKFRDKVEVSLYTMNIDSAFPLPKKISTSNITLAPKNSEIYNQVVILPDVKCTLVPGDSLICSMKIIPSNKTIPNLITKIIDINRFVERWQKRATFLENRKSLPKIQEIGTAIKDLFATMNETGLNITSADIAALFNAMLSTKFIYNSIGHPASVTIPAKITEEDIRDYFLQANQVMSENRPVGTNTSKTKLGTTPVIWNIDQALGRNKILKVANVSAELYFYRFLWFPPRKVEVTVTLYDENTTLATASKELTSKDVQSLLQNHVTPILFTFTGEDREITYGHRLGIGISLANGTKTVLTALQVQYDSTKYASFLRVRYEETQNIQIRNITSTPADEQIIPGGSVKYVLNVTSVKADTLQISILEREKTGNWSIKTPTTMAATAGGSVTIPVFANSTDNLKDAYDNLIDFVIVVTGNTGIARYSTSAEVSRDAIHYDVQLLGYSRSINISKGENRTFYFIIKNNNTGALDDVDSYTVTATSEHGLPLTPRTNIRDVLRGTSTEPKNARVFIEVPANTTAASDVITITVTSDSNSDTFASINITVNIGGGGILDELYNIFDSAAKSLGLKDIFGSDGAFVLGIILTVIILFIFIILALVLTTKPVRVICTDRIKEIEVTEKAVYELTIQNLRKNQQAFELYVEQKGLTEKWIISIDPLSISIDGQQSQIVQITATPTEHAEPGDWVQIPVQVKRAGKKSASRIALMAMLKEGKTLLRLGDVSHWPTQFIPGEKVTTAFTISNDGSITARNVNVFFYLNGKQKHKITVTIPAGNIADIQVPWIAVKGKNKVRIRLKEQ